MAGQKKLLVINVLSPDSFKDCHIKGSINVPLDKLEEYVQQEDRDIPIVVYCGSYQCTASDKAYRLLKNMGFKNLWAYEGGMAEWYQLGYACEGECKKEYLTQKFEKTGPKHDIRQIDAKGLQIMMHEHGIGK